MASEQGPVTATQVADAVRELVAGLREAGVSDGVILIVDELGKFLEFTSRRPDLSDVHVLQTLAEVTAESTPAELLFVTILHQSFASYVGDVRPESREEWSKVQGRFEDIAFLDPPEELLQLLSHAIVHEHGSALQSTREHARKLSRAALELDLFAPGVNKKAASDALVACSPIHPVAALALVRLCRKFGQNHRSLFSFLTSYEPHGFQEFLRNTEIGREPHFFGIDRLYDYVTTTLGNGLLAGEASSRWAEWGGPHCLDRISGFRS